MQVHECAGVQPGSPHVTNSGECNAGGVYDSLTKTSQHIVVTALENNEEKVYSYSIYLKIHFIIWVKFHCQIQQ